MSSKVEYLRLSADLDRFHIERARAYERGHVPNKYLVPLEHQKQANFRLACTPVPISMLVLCEPNHIHVEVDPDTGNYMLKGIREERANHILRMLEVTTGKAANMCNFSLKVHTNDIQGTPTDPGNAFSHAFIGSRLKMYDHVYLLDCNAYHVDVQRNENEDTLVNYFERMLQMVRPGGYLHVSKLINTTAQRVIQEHFKDTIILLPKGVEGTWASPTVTKGNYDTVFIVQNTNHVNDFDFETSDILLDEARLGAKMDRTRYEKHLRQEDYSAEDIREKMAGPPYLSQLYTFY